MLTSRVSSMSSAGTCCQWIGIRHRSVGAGVIIAHEIPTESNFVARPEASAKCGMSIIDAGINDGNLGSFASDTFVVKLLNAGSNQRLVHATNASQVGQSRVAAATGRLDFRASVFEIRLRLRDSRHMPGILDAIGAPDRR